jgi:hypothetical protein
VISRFCPHCGDTFPKDHFRKGRCRKCAREHERERRARHPRDRSTAMQKQRLEVIELHGGRCAAVIDGTRCQETNRLELHHVNGDQSDDRVSNQTPLCREHHELLGHDRNAIFAMPGFTVPALTAPIGGLL